MADCLVLDLPAEARALRAEDPWTEGGHNARTLIKHSEYRVVLLVLKADVSIAEQTVAERVAIQVLRGHVSVRMPRGLVDLAAGGLVTFDRDVPFALSATEPSEVLLWLGWSAQ